MVEYSSSTALTLGGKMTWLDLYEYLSRKANDIKNPDQDMWSSQIIIQNDETGDEYTVELVNFEGRLVLSYNRE